jgi:hypothetical protein
MPWSSRGRLAALLLGLTCAGAFTLGIANAYMHGGLHSAFMWSVMLAPIALLSVLLIDAAIEAAPSRTGRNTREQP